jgi:UPF0755 protein
MRSMRRALSLLLVLLLLGGAAVLGLRALDAQLDAASTSSLPVIIEVPPGATLRGMLQHLAQQSVIAHARWIRWDLRLHGVEPRMQAGTYEIAPHASARSILQQFAEGRVLLESLTVVEGWTFAQMRQALDEHPYVQHQLRGVSSENLMRSIGHDGEAPEGRFFPDTYRFAAGTPDRKILLQAYERMRFELDTAWNAREHDLPIASEQDALILASIIEKETGRADERAKVAAVFVNRLRRGMRLQSDPTVIYGLGSSYDGNIHTRDLQTDTPYNSYTRAGLPPTPIALPGAASLQATLHPAAIDALYFVATADGDGSHHFSATLAEHDLALRAYLHKLGVTPAAGATAHSP